MHFIKKEQFYHNSTLLSPLPIPSSPSRLELYIILCVS